MICKTNLERKVFEVAKPVLLDLGYGIVRIRKTSGAIEIIIDKEDGTPVTISDCEKSGKILPPILDTYDLVKGRYNLEISSPGIERPLTRQKDFESNKGCLIKVILKKPDLDGSKKIKNYLKQVNEDSVVIADDNNDNHREIKMSDMQDCFLLYFEKQDKKNSKLKNMEMVV